MADQYETNNFRVSKFDWQKIGMNGVNFSSKDTTWHLPRMPCNFFHQLFVRLRNQFSENSDPLAELSPTYKKGSSIFRGLQPPVNP